MKKSDFWFDLPEELIAQDPLAQRDASRLLVMDRVSGALRHDVFHNVGAYLRPEDCLVLNDTKVLPARLYGVKPTGARVEFLLLENRGGDVWECITGPGRKAREGDTFVFGEGQLACEVLEVLDNGNRLAKFKYDAANIYEVLDRIGQMPLPHYITHALADRDRYQTVYARERGSAAAPTAGLHFTKELLSQIEASGVSVAYVTLHVGIGTFRPVKTENVEDHEMHFENYVVPQKAAEQINRAKAEGGRVIAVGTTSTRTLESACAPDGTLTACSGSTNIFIYPGYTFKCIDGLITNFHLPESTLIMLVSALSTRENVLRAYNEAIRERYRFFSFGDAMLIL